MIKQWILGIASLLMLANVSHANEMVNLTLNSGTAPLKSGLYKTESFICNAEVQLDDNNRDLYFSGVSTSDRTCGDAGELLIFKRYGGNKYVIIDSDRTMTYQDVFDCASSDNKPTPCRKEFYDSEGNLLLQRGDRLVAQRQIVPINKHSFMFKAITYWYRGSEVLHLWQRDPILYTYRPRN